MRTAFLLLMLTVAVQGPQLLRPDWIGTEAFRTLIAHGMVNSGDYLVPRLGGELMLTKPPLVYWLLAVAEQVAGLGRVALRLPSLLVAWVAVLAIWTVMRRRFDGTTAWWAAFAFLAAPSQLWHAGTAEIDATFAGLTVASLIILADAAVFAPGSVLRCVLAGTFGALALLAKGPPYLMFAAALLPFWWRSGMRVVPTLAFAGIAVAPTACYYALVLGDPAALGADELSELAATESVGRLSAWSLSSLVDAPLHLLRSAALVLPFGLFLRTRGELGLDQGRFVRALLWSYGVGVLVLLVFPVRPARYLLPGTGLAVVGCAPALVAFARSTVPVPRPARIAVLAVGGLFAAVALVVPWLSLPLPTRSVLAAAAVALAAVPAVTSRARVAMFAAVVPTILLLAIGGDRDEQRSHGIRSDRQRAALVRGEQARLGATELEVWGYDSESVIFEVDPDTPWNIRRSGEPRGDSLIWKQRDRDPLPALPAGFEIRSHVRGRSQDHVRAVRQR
ncbi:MAG: ArnT family glycosyltransferase [Planctomycetota bacterium]